MEQKMKTETYETSLRVITNLWSGETAYSST